MPERRTGVPKPMAKRLYQEVQSRCPLCDEDNVTKLTVHHIVPYAESKEHDPAHMVVLCANCHARATAGEIDRDKLYKAKHGPPIYKFPGAETMNQHVVGNGNVVAGRDVTIRVQASSKHRAMPRPAGTVCDDPRKVGYLQYLADRYNQFRKCDLQNGEKMRGGFIHGAYKRHMKYAIRTTPMEHFEEGAVFLQGRILRTKLGRILNARGQRVFSSFDEFDGHGDLSMPEEGVNA
ncbi:MAG: HNH endonuclease [bacterium]|nr:HNH endonuclease [bacterium]